MTLEVDVRNTGNRAGQAVVQLYVSDAQASVARPGRELKAFAKLHLAAGASGTAKLTLTMRAFAFYDVAHKRWTAEAGSFGLHLGTTADSTFASYNVVLAGNWHG
jgi:beta-glucosidase